MSPIWQPPASGGGAVATDVIWDTKGDLAAATGADAAVKVAAGTDGKVLTADAASSAGVKWASRFISQTENTTTAFALTGTTSGTANTIVTAPSFTANGTDAYLFQWGCCNAIQSAGSNIYILLYEDGSLRSILSYLLAPTGSWNAPLTSQQRFVPASGSRTYVLKGFSDNGGAIVTGGAGSGGDYLPIFLRIERDV